MDFRSGNAPTTSRTASSAPAMTIDVGPLIAAMETASVSRGSTSSSVACNATIAPPAGRACMRRPRSPTSLAASSRERTPATWAAAISPMEWPPRWSGFTPHDSKRR